MNIASIFQHSAAPIFNNTKRFTESKTENEKIDRNLNPGPGSYDVDKTFEYIEQGTKLPK